MKDINFMRDASFVERRTHNPWPLQRTERRICTLVIACLFSGVVASVLTHSGEWLERFGSLIVVVGIYFAYRDFKGVFSRLRIYQKERITELEARMAKVRDSLASESKGLMYRHTETTKTFNDLQGELDELQSMTAQTERLLVRLEDRTRMLEVGVIVFGTLVSGFGGLVFEAIHGHWQLVVEMKVH